MTLNKKDVMNGMKNMMRCGAIAIACAFPHLGHGAVTVFFDEAQVATIVATGTTSDTISSEGYLFTFTRDKLFTGGVGLTNPIGRSVRVPWPQGVEAQAVTTGPVFSSAKITIRRVDGGLFDLTSFTAKLLANTFGAGGSIEIMPKLDGEDARNDPYYFDASGSYGMLFSYNTTTPGYQGNTSPLTNYEAYVISLYVDYALTALTLDNVDVLTNHAPTDIDISHAFVPENEPAVTWIGTLSTVDVDISDTFAYTLVNGAGGDDNYRFYLVDADLYAAIPFNFEIQSNFSIRVESSDQGLLFTQKILIVHVQDVDEPPPELHALPVMTETQSVINWTSMTNHTYSLYESTNLMEGFHLVEGGMAATPPFNMYTSAVTAAETRVWMITTEP